MLYLFTFFMLTTINLKPGRGTELRKNLNNSLQISVKSESPQKIRVLIDDTFFEYDALKKSGKNIEIKPGMRYWIINLSDANAEVSIEAPSKLEFETIYDPYLLEFAKKEDFDAAVMQKKFGVPDGFVDTLPKWYSIKFTYPDYNFIFVRPGIGISLQSHKMRNEHWEIASGNPHIIVGNKIHYSVKAGTKFNIPIGTEHTIINPNKEEWVSLREKYTGTFDEKDIERIYNPNNYH